MNEASMMIYIADRNLHSLLLLYHMGPTDRPFEQNEALINSNFFIHKDEDMYSYDVNTNMYRDIYIHAYI